VEHAGAAGTVVCVLQHIIGAINSMILINSGITSGSAQECGVVHRVLVDDNLEGGQWWVAGLPHGDRRLEGALLGCWGLAGRQL
jgi:hypothetical protein